MTGGLNYDFCNNIYSEIKMVVLIVRGFARNETSVNPATGTERDKIIFKFGIVVLLVCRTTGRACCCSGLFLIFHTNDLAGNYAASM